MILSHVQAQQDGVEGNALSRQQFDLTRFGLKDMAMCGMGVRKCAEGGRSMEEVAGRVVRYLYDSFRSGDDERQCLLIRFFKTHRFGDLDAAAARAARNMLGDQTASEELRCLLMLATQGDESAWNDRHTSSGHHAIPLPSRETIERLPMVLQLVRQLGLQVRADVVPTFDLMVDPEHRAYNVFYVPEAVGSPHIPAQRDFVERCGVRSVLGFGGLLPEKNMFAVIMFTRVTVPQATARMFNTVGLNTRQAIADVVHDVFQAHGAVR